MDVHLIPGRGFDSNIYLIVGKTFTLIDTGLGLNHDYVVEEIKRYIAPEEIKQIILTHEHIDHCRGAKKLIEETGENTILLAHRYATDRLKQESNRMSEIFGVFMPSIKIDKRLENGDVIDIGDRVFQVIHTPGHSPGSICLYDETKKLLFSGDTVFSHGGFGRYDFPGGDPFALLKSLEKLASLDVENVYPGHGEMVIGMGSSHIKLALQNLRLLI